MSSIHDHLNKIREERMAREKARIEKLRELNLKKYNKNETQTIPKSVSTMSVASTKPDIKKTNFSVPKNNFHVNGTTKRPITAPVLFNKKTDINKTSMSTLRQSISDKNTRNEIKTMNLVKDDRINVKTKTSDVKLTTVTEITNNVQTMTHIESKVEENVETITKIDQNSVTVENIQETVQIESKLADAGHKITKKSVNRHHELKPERKTINFIENNKKFEKKTDVKNSNAKGDANITNNKTIGAKTDPKSARKSYAPRYEPSKTIPKPKPENYRKSLVPPKTAHSATKPNPNRQSVFERLYQPKLVAKKQVSDSEKLQNDPSFLKKVIKNTGLILNKRHTVFEHSKQQTQPPVRRSISAVHFRRISKNELGNCFHKWSSIGDKLDQVHLADINEDANVKGDKIVSAIKSERKKVKFQTPIPNLNTPRPEELQSRLKSWLQKRGKSLDSYHHLQCFGLHHLQQEIKPLNLEVEQFDDFNNDDEDKENQPLESDSDNDSYEENMNVKEDEMAKDKWRRASVVSESVDFNESQHFNDSTLTPRVEMHHVDELLLGALNDLTELLREGFDWEQCARWLRAIRERFPSAPDSAAYWECRAALEERRGDLPASVHCWQEAVAKGTERSVVEANLDQLLDKFMQLKISPNSGKKKQPDPKMVDVKNVFKSTLIRFAVQQAKLRQSQEAPKFTVTPVRRSGRLSNHWSAKRTPLQVVASVRQAGLLGHPLVFVPNDKLSDTP